MGKKLLYLLLAVFLGGFIVLQSCNESPFISTETTTPPSGGDYLGPCGLLESSLQGTGVKSPNIFAGIGSGLPKRCPALTEKLELYFSQTLYAGYIEFLQSNITGNIRVKYHLVNCTLFGSYPWAIEEIHFHIGDKFGDIPTLSSGYPDLVAFAYSMVFDPVITDSTYEFEYTLPADTDQDGYYISAQAYLCIYGGAEGFDFYLPDGPIQYHVERDYGLNTYYKINFLNGTGGILGSGPFESWCVDAELGIHPPVDLTGQIYSAYETLPANLQAQLNHWENLDIVNWILNNFETGDIVPQYSYDDPLTTAKWPFVLSKFHSTGSNGTLKWQDIQCAIWAVLESDPVNNFWHIAPGYTANNVWSILYSVITSAPANFVPACDEKISAILVPNNGNIQIITIQPTIITLEIPCYTCCGNAFGDGRYGANFPLTTKWATYFRWNNSCP
jgi:hypothetical protein